MLKTKQKKLNPRVIKRNKRKTKNKDRKSPKTKTEGTVKCKLHIICKIYYLKAYVGRYMKHGIYIMNNIYINIYMI